jgi:hypothetical protein
LVREKETAQVRSDLLKFGAEKVAIFESWASYFRLESTPHRR